MSDVPWCQYCTFGECSACHGTGFRDVQHGEEPDEGMTCPICDGSGVDPTYARARRNGMPASGRSS